MSFDPPLIEIGNVSSVERYFTASGGEYNEGNAYAP